MSYETEVRQIELNESRRLDVSLTHGFELDEVVISARKDLSVPRIVFTKYPPNPP